ncbi:MAG: response regulator transcription factor [Chloroflexi bacterium]|nr:response regulator transcription factor [Chloroflexota bacterium]
MSAPVHRIRILLADDHAVLRAGLKLLLNGQPDMAVVGEAGDGAATVALARETRPDLVLMDLSMPGVGGLEATRLIHQQLPAVRVLVLSMYDDERYLRESLEAGASGYILKRAADTELLAAVRAVHRGETYLHPSLTTYLVDSLLHRQPAPRSEPLPAGATPAPSVLSERERAVLVLVARGHTNQQVADLLGLSVKTVETYKTRLMDKLGCRGRAALVRYAIEHGLL